MDEFTCPWCGADLLTLLAEKAPCSLDTVYETHAEDCEPWLREQGLIETTTDSLPCEGEPE